MAKRRSQYTSIPRSSKSDSTVDAIAANIELLTGQKGQSGKRAVLVEDLEDMGFASFKNGRLRALKQEGVSKPNGTVSPDKPIIEKPTRPLNVVGAGGFQYASIRWDNPAYVGHAYAEVFFSSTDSFSSAVRVGVTPANIFSLALPIDGAGYFWVRFINEAGDVGPINDASGVHITTVGNIDYLLSKMKGQIDFDQLAPGVSSEVNKIPAIDTESKKIPAIESGIDNFENVVIPKINTDISNNREEIKRIVDESIPALQDTLDKQWDDSDSLASSIIENALGADYDRGSNNARFAKIINKQTVITDEQQSLAQEIKVLVAQFDGYSAEYTNLVKVVANNQEATTKRFTSLNSKVDNVRAGIFEDVYTKVQTNEAISSATTALKSAIEDPDGSSVAADLHRNFYTKASTDSAITKASNTLKSEYTTADKKVSDDINSNLTNNYLTSSEITNNYYTKADADSAISTAATSLKSEYKAADKAISDSVDSVKNDLANNYYSSSSIDSKFYTKSDTDSAISLSSNSIKSEYEAADSALSKRIDGVISNTGNFYTKAEINQSFYTKSDVDGAISQSETSLKSAYKAADKALSDRIDNADNDISNVYTKAEIDNTHYTKSDVDGAISTAKTSLKAEYTSADKAINDRIDHIDTAQGNFYTKAEINNDFYTKTDADGAIAKASTDLKSAIEDPKGSSIGANLANNYYTKSASDSAMSGIETSLRSEYKKADAVNSDAINGVKSDLSNNYYTTADIKRNYYTKSGVDSAISEINTSISSDWMGSADELGEVAIENALNDDTSRTKNRKNFATITQRQATFADELSAMASDYIELKAGVGDNSSELSELRQVQVTQKESSSRQFNKLSSDFNNLSAGIKVNYYTKSDVDSAISQTENSLRSEYTKDINNVSDDLSDNYYTSAQIDNNFYTKADSDRAISTAKTTLKSEIEDPKGQSVGAKVEVNRLAVSGVDGYQRALWGVKVSAGDITASVGLVAKSNPADPKIDNSLFVVKNADFRVIYDSGNNSNEVTPIFGTIDNPVYDPNAETDPAEPGYDPHKIPRKVLVIDTAKIRVADIKNLVAGDIIADSIVSNTTISSPTINGGTLRGGTLGIGAGGAFAGYHTFINSKGQISTDNLHATGGYFKGNVNADGGYFRGDITGSNGTFEGTVKAKHIIGDIVSGKAVYLPAQDYVNQGAWIGIASASCGASSAGIARMLYCSGISLCGTYTDDSESLDVGFEWRVLVNGNQVAYAKVITPSARAGIFYKYSGNAIAIGGGSIGAGGGSIEIQIRRYGYNMKITRNAQTALFSLVPHGAEFY